MFTTFFKCVFLKRANYIKILKFLANSHNLEYNMFYSQMAMFVKYFRERAKMDEKMTLEIPRLVTTEEIRKGISIQNPGMEEERTYVSKQEVNGCGKQTFTSDEYPDVFPLVYTGKTEKDPGNGKENPLFVVPVITSPLTIFGKAGWYACNEFDKIPRTLLSQKGVANIRCAKESDFDSIDIPKGKFWLPSPTFETDKTGVVHFYMKYMDDGEVKSCELYSSDDKECGGTINCGILAVVALDTKLKDDKPRERVRGLWG